MTTIHYRTEPTGQTCSEEVSESFDLVVAKFSQHAVAEYGWPVFEKDGRRWAINPADVTHISTTDPAEMKGGQHG